MKISFPLVGLVLVLSTSWLFATDESPTPDVSERIMQVDLSVALKQYEKIEQMIADARLDLSLAALRSGDPGAKEQSLLSQRIDILNKQAVDLRATALSCDDQLRKRHALAAADQRR